MECILTVSLARLTERQPLYKTKMIFTAPNSWRARLKFDWARRESRQSLSPHRRLSSSNEGSECRCAAFRRSPPG